MKAHHKHLHLARRRMSHIIDEIYTALLHCGSTNVDLHIAREEDGLRLFAAADYRAEHADDVRRMGELLHPAVRSPAMVEEFWELIGDDQYSSDSELALVGQAAETVAFSIEPEQVKMELFVRY